jgi:hypothetical protein
MLVQPNDLLHFYLEILQDFKVILSNSKIMLSLTSMDKYPSVYVAGYFLFNKSFISCLLFEMFSFIVAS